METPKPTKPELAAIVAWKEGIIRAVEIRVYKLGYIRGTIEANEAHLKTLLEVRDAIVSKTKMDDH